MAHYRFLGLIIVICLGVRSSYGQKMSTAATSEESTPLGGLLREVEDNSRYKTLEANATLLKLLVNDKSGVSRSEVFDMLHSRDENQDHMDLPVFPEDAEDSRMEVPSIPDAQAELLQAPEGVVRKDSGSPREGYTEDEPVGTAAGIMVGVTCSIVMLAYTTLIVWRRIYLKRNGLKHELLRNEEVNIAETRIEL